MAVMVAMMLGGVVLSGFGLHAAVADHRRQHRFATAAACPAGASAAGLRRGDCVARSTRGVSYISTMKDTTMVSLDGDTQMLRFDRAPSWIQRLTDGDPVTVLRWHGQDEALSGPGRDAVYAQDSPLVAEDNHLAAALLGAMFACYGGSIALSCARRGFGWGARLYRRFMRAYDVVAAELAIVAVSAMVGSILVGHGDVRIGIVLPLIAIPVASAAAVLVLRARFHRDLLRLRALAAAGPVPDLE